MSVSTSISPSICNINETCFLLIAITITKKLRNDVYDFCWDFCWNFVVLYKRLYCRISGWIVSISGIQSDIENCWISGPTLVITMSEQNKTAAWPRESLGFQERFDSSNIEMTKKIDSHFTHNCSRF